MINNFVGKAKCSSAKTSPIKLSTKHLRKESFDVPFNTIPSWQRQYQMTRQKQYQMIESPHLDSRLIEITNHFEDKLLSGMSTPTNKTFKRLQRRKYIDIKQKIYQSVLQFQSLDLSNLQQLFTYKQTILSEYLNQFTQEITKECKQKGDILKYLWNSMFSMIEHIAQQMAKHFRKQEAHQLNNHIKQHKDYQELIEKYKSKQSHLAQKMSTEKTTIAKLIYELRFKRKQLNKMYKNQKILTNKLNELKNENLQIQSSYIDIVSSLKDIPPADVQQMLKAREQIARSKQVKIKIKGNKKSNKKEIKEQMNTNNIEALSQLLEQIKDIATNQLNSPRLITTMIEAAVENFGMRYDDKNASQGELIQTVERSHTAEVAVQACISVAKKIEKVDQVTQVSYFDKLTNNQVSNKLTQTFTIDNSAKKFNERGSGTEDLMKKYVTWNFRMVKVVAYNFVPKKGQEEPVIVVIPAKIERAHKKHMSDLNMLGGGYYDKDSSEFNEITETRFKNSTLNRSDSNFLGQKETNKSKEHKPKRAQKEKKPSKMIKVSRKSYVPANNRGTSVQHKKKQQKQELKQEQLNEIDINERKSRNTGGRISSGSGSPNRSKNPSVFSRSKKRQGTLTINHYSRIKSDFARINLVDNQNNCIAMDEDKKNEINNFFVNRGKNSFCYNMDEEQQEDSQIYSKQLEDEVITKTLNHIDTINERSQQRKVTSCQKSQNERGSIEMNIDEQDLLLNVCRNKYYQRGKKKKEGTLFKYRDEFTSVKQNIEMIAKDVRQMILKKEDFLKKAINSRSLKNIYKILMMTFAKAYDCYNKGIVIKNIVFPLFQSLSLIYGAINTTEIYKKMINFIACLSLKTENTIFKFFLFFLGLDSKNPYSEHVTISQVYLSLALLEKISIQGKVTLNIDSIYTDTSRIKQELMGVLKQQKIPEHLCGEIKKRVNQELESSSSLRNSSDEDAQLKVNIYNIILLIIQEVIKCKHNMKLSFDPIFQCCEEYENLTRVPIALLQSIMAMLRKEEEQNRILRVINSIKKNNRTQTLRVQLFCSILFDHNVTNLRQLVEDNFLPIFRCKMPPEFVMMCSKKTRFSCAKQQFELKLFSKLISLKNLKSIELNTSVEVMKKIIFVKYYYKFTQELMSELIGEDLKTLIQLRS